MKIKFEINGHPIEVDENPKKKLSEFLRQNNYFSIKNGCNQGKCGSCTILFNSIPMLSCLIPLAQVENAKITTLENFVKTEDYVDIDKAFKQTGINFCGYCNAGKILMTYKIIRFNPLMSREDIREQISFFTCNCVEIGKLTSAIYLASTLRRNRLKEKKHEK